MRTQNIMTPISYVIEFVASVILVASIGTPQFTNAAVLTIAYPPQTAATTTSLVLVKPVPVKPVAKKIASGVGDCSAYADLIKQYPWPVAVAMQICRDESHGKAMAINWNDKHRNRNGNIICISSRGLMGIACIWPKEFGYTIEQLAEPAINVRIAYLIWLRGGFGPWSTFQG